MLLTSLFSLVLFLCTCNSSIFASAASSSTHCLTSATATSSAAAEYSNSNGLPGHGNKKTYTNPILNETGADPWMVRGGDGWYYLTYTTGSEITLLRSRSIVEWNNAPRKTIFTPPPHKPYSTDLWAPEIHFFPSLSRWFVIFTADPSSDSPIPSVDMLCTFSCPAVHHRMYVLESSSSSIWDSEYAFKGQLETFDQFAIDGTYLKVRGRLYHVYSCWRSEYESWPANLCITELSSPLTTISTLSHRATISSPTQPWEKTPYNRTVNVRLATNEGPEQLVNPHTGQVFLVYSAGRSDNANYCLGLLELARDGDPMDPHAWTKSPGCVFAANPAESVYGVGHASFVRDDDKEWWVVYHGMSDPTRGWEARTIRAQRFAWDERTGWPVFGKPGVGPFRVDGDGGL